MRLEVWMNSHRCTRAAAEGGADGPGEENRALTYADLFFVNSLYDREDADTRRRRRWMDEGISRTPSRRRQFMTELTNLASLPLPSPPSLPPPSIPYRAILRQLHW